MTKQQAIAILRSASEDGDLSEHEEELFRALYGRAPDQNDYDTGLVDLCYAAIV